MRLINIHRHFNTEKSSELNLFVLKLISFGESMLSLISEPFSSRAVSINPNIDSTVL
jgi:hypothetical protein